jgi:hypothetical protein
MRMPRIVHGSVMHVRVRLYSFLCPIGLARKIEWRKNWATPAQRKICPKRGEKDGQKKRELSQKDKSNKKM